MRYRPALILITVSIALAVATTAVVSTTRAIRSEMRESLAVQTKSLAEAAGAVVDRDAHRAVATSRSLDSDEYRRIETALRELRDGWKSLGVPVRFIYTLVPDKSSASGLAYAVDCAELAEKSKPGEPLHILSESSRGFDWRSPAAFEYTDAWGNFYSGFVPVRAQDGTIQFVVGVDLSAEAVRSAEWRVALQALLPVAVVMVLALLVARFFGERLVRPLIRLRVFAESVGKGDLTAKADPDAPGEAGEIGRALDSALAELRRTVSEADANAVRVRDACERLLSSGDDRRAAIRLAGDRASDAAARARIVAESAEALLGDAQALTDFTGGAVGCGTNALGDIVQIDAGVQAVIERGRELANQLESMRARAATVDNALEAMVHVANRSAVLSLNAEIEANQAGDAGRGFAVVAREIRRLAEQAARSSLEIEDNVRKLHEALDAGGRATQEFGAAATQASERSARLSTAMAESVRRLEGIGPRLRAVSERSSQFRREGESMQADLRVSEEAAAELRGFLEGFEETLAELRDRSSEVHGLLARLRTH
ncbi:MAG: methyl-accepting chemotaxis protein [Phycisphaerales bacterium]